MFASQAARVLVVEDEPLVALDLQHCLEHLGHAVLPNAKSAREALCLAREQAADLVLLDVQLERTEDASTAANLIRSALEVPIIYLASRADDETLERVQHGGPCEYLLKPVDRDALRAALDLTLGSRRLPERQPFATPIALAVGVAAPGPRRLRVLIVDDEPAVARVFGRMIELEHDVTICEGGCAAMDLIMLGGQRFDAILCDLMMPVMTGFELSERLSQCAPDQAQRMIFITGGVFTSSAAAFLARPTVRHLRKPISWDELRMVLRERARASAL